MENIACIYKSSVHFPGTLLVSLFPYGYYSTTLGTSPISTKKITSISMSP